MKQDTESDKQASGDNLTITNKGRRTALKTLVYGVTAAAAYSVLPDRWSQPIITEVFIPAHAATSGEIAQELSLRDGNYNDTMVVSVQSQGNNDSDSRHRGMIESIAETIGDFLVANAYAIANNVLQEWCVTVNNGTASFYGQTSMGTGIAVASGPADKTLEYVDPVNPGIIYHMRITSWTETSITVRITIDYDGSPYKGTGILPLSATPCTNPT